MQNRTTNDVHKGVDPGSRLARPGFGLRAVSTRYRFNPDPVGAQSQHLIRSFLSVVHKPALWAVAAMVALSSLAGSAQAQCTTTPLALTATISATLTNACVITNSAPLPTGTSVMQYSFSGSAGQKISIAMSSSAFDTEVQLISPQGGLLASNDDGGGGTNSRIPAQTGFFTLPSNGTYQIWAAAHVVGQGGLFSLVVTADCTNVGGTAITLPVTRTDTLTGACIVPSGTTGLTGNASLKIYNFNGTTGQRISILMTSSFDTRLQLRDGQNTILATDDDGGGGTNSRIPPGSGTFTLPSNGAYFIWATAFNTATEGSFTLTTTTDSPCTYSFPFASGSVISWLPEGQTGSILLQTQTGCPWTAASNVPWLTVVNASGSGQSQVSFTAAPNNTAGTRSGTVTIAGMSVNVSQASNLIPTCTFTVDPALSVAATAGTATINVGKSAASCVTWSAVSNAAFITVTNQNLGGASGSVSILFTANPSTSPRSGTLTIAGQTVTVTQSGSSCNYTLSATSATILAAGGTGSVNVTTTSSCQWSASSPDPSVIITTGANGTGNGTVSFSVQANSGTAPRTITLTIAGTTFAVIQTGTSGGTTSGPLRFVPLDPCRVMETRPEYNFQGRTGSFGPPFMRANENRTLNLPVSNVCQVPATAKAYLLNVTLIPRSGGVDFVTVYPSGEGRPTFFSVRSPDAQIVANSAIVKAGANGGIDVFTTSDTDMIIDIAGYFTDNANVSNLVFYPLTPCRVVDTRAEYSSAPAPYGPPSMTAQGTRRIRLPGAPQPCSIPNARAYSMTITAVPPGPLQFLTAWPSGGAQPNVSSINSPAGRVLANTVILPAASDGSIDVFTFDRTDFLIDVNGYYAPDDGVNGLFYFPVTQCRAADSTSTTLGGSFGTPIYETQSTRTLTIPNSPGCSGIPSTAKAFVVNVTALPNGLPMPFITAYPTGQARPNASILNAFQGQIVTNTAIVPAGSFGSIDVYAFGRTNVIVEISGYFGR